MTVMFIIKYKKWKYSCIWILFYMNLCFLISSPELDPEVSGNKENLINKKCYDTIYRLIYRTTSSQKLQGS